MENYWKQKPLGFIQFFSQKIVSEFRVKRERAERSKKKENLFFLPELPVVAIYIYIKM